MFPVMRVVGTTAARREPPPADASLWPPEPSHGRVLAVQSPIPSRASFVVGASASHRRLGLPGHSQTPAGLGPLPAPWTQAKPLLPTYPTQFTKRTVRPRRPTT